MMREVRKTRAAAHKQTGAIARSFKKLSLKFPVGMADGKTTFKQNFLRFRYRPDSDLTSLLYLFYLEPKYRIIIHF